MFKTLLISILGLLFLQTAKAQKPDSVLYNMKKSGQIVQTKDSADYVLQIMTPPDISTGAKIYPIREFYLNGKCKLVGAAEKTMFRMPDKTSLYLSFKGKCISYDYYQNGHLKSMRVCRDGIYLTDLTKYYPNGQLYTCEKFDEKYRLLKIDCCDSTGKVLAENGNGKWIEFDRDFKKTIQEGMVKDSLKYGEWRDMKDDTGKLLIDMFKKGEIIYSIDTTKKGDTVFMSTEIKPKFKNGDTSAFNTFIARTIKFPAYDRNNYTRDLIDVAFVVEKDGTLSNIEVLSGTDKAMKDAVVQAIQQSPSWVAGMQNGHPERVELVTLFHFDLSGKAAN